MKNKMQATKNIITLTLNPVFDYTQYLPDTINSKVNTGVRSVMTAGGKGINVGRTLQKQGASVVNYFLKASSNGSWFEQILKQEELETVSTPICSDIRVNTHLVFPDGKFIKANDSGSMICSTDKTQIVNDLNRVLPQYDYAILAGSFPLGIEFDDVRESLSKTKLIVDTSGKNLLQAIHSSPFMIKVNSIEWQSALNIKLTCMKDWKKNLQEISNRYPIDTIIVTSEEDSSIYCLHKNIFLNFNFEKVQSKRTFGAGDYFLGSFINRFLIEEIDFKQSIIDSIKLTAEFMKS